MEYAKKMILVDPRMMDSLQTSSGPPVPDANSQSLREMDRGMRDVLERKDISFEDKADMYHQILWRYLKRFEQYKEKPLGTVTVKQPNSELHAAASDIKVDDLGETEPQQWGRVAKEVVDSVPVKMKRKAERILQRLQQHPELKWNSQGEIEFEGQLVKNSNLVDLVNDVLRKRKNFEPTGWKTFATALQRMNVPQDLIGHPERWDFIRTQIPVSSPPPAQLSPTVTTEALEGAKEKGGFTPVLSRKTKRRRKRLGQVAGWTPY